MDEGTIIVYSCPSTFPLTSSSPPPSQTKCTVYTDSVWLGWGGGVELYCRPYSAGVLHFVLTRFSTYKSVSPPKTKMTSKDDIKGLVSLKFLRPWFSYFTHSPCDAAIGKWTVKIRPITGWQAQMGGGGEGGSIQVVNRGSWYQIEIEIPLYLSSCFDRSRTDLEPRLL